MYQQLQHAAQQAQTSHAAALRDAVAERDTALQAHFGGYIQQLQAHQAQQEQALTAAREQLASVTEQNERALTQKVCVVV